MREIYQGPKTAMEQPEVQFAKEGIYGPRVEELRLATLHQEVLESLAFSHVPVHASSFRLKDPSRMLEKLDKRNDSSDHPLRIVLNEEDKWIAIHNFHTEWPTPQSMFGIPTIRIGRNRRSHQDFTAVRMNIVFDETKIAEIQLLNPEEAQQEEKTRDAYRRRRQKI